MKEIQDEMFPRNDYWYKLAYPDAPGYKQKGSTSQEAAESFKALGRLQADCFAVLEQTASTADEVASALNISILSIRPRISELLRKGKIIDSGERRHNDSGKRAIVWKAV